MDFAVCEVVAELALFAAEAGNRAGEAVAFATDRLGVPDLPGHVGTVGMGPVELGFDAA